MSALVKANIHCRRICNRDQVRLRKILLSLVSIGVFIYCYLKSFNHDRRDTSLYFSGENSESRNSLDNTGTRNNHLKTILWYNDPHFIITEVFGTGHEPFVQYNCPVSDCALYTSPTDKIPLKNFDAVIFRAIKLKNITKEAKRELITPDPNRRSSHQRYIFYDLEPPLEMRMVNWKLYANFYNWTMTYKKDSDIWMPYGKVEPLPNVELPLHPTMLPKHEKEISSLVAGKNKLVAWFVSHCITDSAREVYVQYLNKYVPVDIYGKCGNMTCPRIEGTHYSEEACYAMVEKTYKFYLSLENALCTEYVTEKLFSVLKHHIVPVVYGSADYKSLLPEHSYINALDYTPEELATYLKYLDQNNTAYQEYFWWKPYYKLYANWNAISPITMCKLCEKLHQPLIAKTIPDISKLQGTKSNCLLRPKVLQLMGISSPFMLKIQLGPVIRSRKFLNWS